MGALATSRSTPTAVCLGHVAAQCAVVIQVLPAQCKSVHALAQQVGHAVGDQERVAWVGDATGRRLHQTQLAVGGAEQHDADIADHAATVKLAFHHTPAKTAKFDLVVCGFLCTAWHWQSHTVTGFRNP